MISFWCTFPTWCFPYLILYLLAKLECYTFFPSQDIKKNMLLSFYLSNWWHHKQTLRFIFNYSLKQWPIGRKRVEDRNTKIWISPERKKFFRGNRKQFLKFWIGYHLLKKKKKLADTSFKRQGFIQGILMSGRRHKRRNVLIEFPNSIFIKIYLKAYWR